MNSDKFLEFVRQQRDFCDEVIMRYTNEKSLLSENVRLSKMIAALVLEHGGKVSHENWDRANADETFILHGLSRREEGVFVKVTLRAEAPV